MLVHKKKRRPGNAERGAINIWERGHNYGTHGAYNIAAILVG
jgi:hypothetical protein